MNESTRQALIAKFTALADDEMILAQRNGEWVGHAPILEEDIALANITQDELGHALVWLNLRQQLDGSNPDALAFLRDASEFTNTELVELPKGDWAFTMLRQYLYDAYEALWLSAATQSAYGPLAEAASKLVKEERFHLQHTHLWVERLGQGTEESNRRLQQALDRLWPYAQQLFVPLPGEAELQTQGLLPDLAAIKTAWLEHVTRHLQNSGLKLPLQPSYQPTSRHLHTEHLSLLLAEMQSVARWDSEAKAW